MNDLDYADPDFLLKLVLVGDSGAGKTNLLSRFARDEFSPDSKSTIGVEFAAKVLRIDEKIVKAQIWDTAGQERYRAITAAYYRGAVGAILVYDVTSTRTFQSLPLWLKELRAHTSNDVLIVVVGNKTDRVDDRVVTTEEGLHFSQREKTLFMETSALHRTNVSEMFELVIGHIVARMVSEGTEPDSMAATLVKPRGVVVAPAPDESKGCCARGTNRTGARKTFRVMEPPKDL
jgi:small GTP-binding protein